MQVNTNLFLMLVSLLIQMALGNYTQSPTESTQISWIAELKQLRRDLGNCYRISPSLWSCFRSRTLNSFDKIMSTDVIPLYEGIILKALPNATNMQAQEDENFRRSHKYHTWFDQLSMSLAKGLTTHTLQINLAKLTERYLKSETDSSSNNIVGSARLRRHRFNMIITMMFGVTALGAVLVPMGFQMLSIVSGKALLLAKMALLLASINGLKRVANSGLHYGLYHVPGEHLGGYYDRGDLNHPRNVPIPVAVAPSLDVGLK